MLKNQAVLNTLALKVVEETSNIREVINHEYFIELYKQLDNYAKNYVRKHYMQHDLYIDKEYLEGIICFETLRRTFTSWKNTEKIDFITLFNITLKRVVLDYLKQQLNNKNYGITSRIDTIIYTDEGELDLLDLLESDLDEKYYREKEDKYFYKKLRELLTEEEFKVAYILINVLPSKRGQAYCKLFNVEEYNATHRKKFERIKKRIGKILKENYK